PRFLCCCRARTTTSDAPAAASTPAAPIERTQLRGSFIALSSQSASSSAAASTCSVSRRSRLSVSDGGGSIGTSAERNRRSTSLILPCLLQVLVELPDGTVNQHLRGALGAPQCPRDLLVVHIEGEPHDQRLSSIVGQVRHSRKHLLELLPLLHELGCWVR